MTLLTHGRKTEAQSSEGELHKVTWPVRNRTCSDSFTTSGGKSWQQLTYQQSLLGGGRDLSCLATRLNPLIT